jgi:hypothetical protein
MTQHYRCDACLADIGPFIPCKGMVWPQFEIQPVRKHLNSVEMRWRDMHACCLDCLMALAQRLVVEDNDDHPLHWA